MRADDLIAQFESVFSRPAALDGVIEVDLFNSGSFFANQEIPPAVRDHVLGRLAPTAVERILVEARPEFVETAKLAAACALVGDCRLEVGIGLESADDHVRDVLVHKGFGRADFEQAVARLAEFPARLLAYILVKPLGLDENQAIADAVASVKYVFNVARQHGVPSRVALEPVFVAPGTALEREFLAGRYRPPGLWSVIDVVRRIHGMGELLIGTSDEGLHPQMVPLGCDLCTRRLREAIATYNGTHELSAFAGTRLSLPSRSGLSWNRKISCRGTLMSTYTRLTCCIWLLAAGAIAGVADV